MYHFKLCRALVVGFRNQFKQDGNCKHGFIGMFDLNFEGTDVAAQLPLYSIQHAGETYNVKIDGDTVFRDDFTGQVLDLVRVRAARLKEILASSRVTKSGSVLDQAAIGSAGRRASHRSRCVGSMSTRKTTRARNKVALGFAPDQKARRGTDIRFYAITCNV